MWNIQNNDSTINELPVQVEEAAPTLRPKRIKPTITQADTALQIADSSAVDSLVADSVATDSLGIALPADSLVHPVVEVPTGLTGLPPSSLLRQQDGIFFILITCFVFLGLFLQRGYSFFSKSIVMLFSFRKQEELSNQLIVKEAWESIFLSLLPPLLVSLLLFQYFQLNDMGEHPPYHTVTTLVGFTLTISVFLIIQHFIYSAIGFIFDGKAEMLLYQRMRIIGTEMFGILIFAPTIVTLYSAEYAIYILWGLLGIFVTFKLVLFSHFITIFLRQKGSILIGICYLCGVEVAPYVLLFLGMQFAYKEGIFCIL